VIWAKCMGPTALSGTTEVLVGGEEFKIPQQARCILAIIPYLSSPGGPTAGEPIIARVSLVSDDFKIQPYSILAQPIGSSLGKSGIQPQLEAPKFPVNCRVPGGAGLEIRAAGLIDHTVEPRVGVTLILSDFVARPQFFSKLGVLTDTGTAAKEVKGAGIRLTGIRKIVEVFGLVVGTTVAANEGIMGRYRLSSAGLIGMGDIEFMAEPISGAIATDATTASIQELAKLTRLTKLDIPTTDPIDLDDYFNLAVALTTSGKWLLGIRYT